MKPVVIITGGTGLVGRALQKQLLQTGYRVIIMSRNPSAENTEDSRQAYWNPAKQEIEEAAIREADYIINLAGAGVADKRWSEKRKAEILNSRVQSGQLLVKALRDMPNKVKAVVQASAIGWYGPDRATPNPGDSGFKESDPAYPDYLGSTCVAWEDSVSGLKKLNKRVVILRTGIVLSRNGGALTEFLKPLRFRVAAVLGSGRQVVSWIQEEDLVQMYIMAMENEQWTGVYNAVAPAPVTNKELTLTLARMKRGKGFISFRIPSIVLKIILGEMSVEVLKSARVSSEKIREAGYFFKYADISRALKASVQ